MVLIVMANIVPGVLIFIFSILTGVGLYKSRARREEMGVNNNNNHSNDNREFRITTMLLIEATFFFVTRVTMSILVQLNRHYQFSSLVLTYLLKVFSVLGTLNHSTNIFFYLILLQEFRRSFADMMTMTMTMMCNCCGGLLSRIKSQTAHDLVLDVMRVRDVDGNDCVIH